MVAIRAQLVMLGAVGLGGLSLLLFAYFVCFGPPFPLPIANSHAARLAFDSLLCVGFFVQHSGMIRRGPRNRVAQWVGATYQGAVYSIASGTALILLVLLWQPTDEFLFHLRGGARWLSACVALLAVAGFVWGVRSLGTFDPFGTLPIKAALRGTPEPSIPLVTRGPYRYVRHPLYLFMLMLIWSTPRLSTDQLLFNVLWTGWVVLGTRLEERDLLADLGQAYREYQLTVPMLVPSRGRNREHPPSRHAAEQDHGAGGASRGIGGRALSSQSMHIDVLEFCEPVLSVKCSGRFGVGSEGNPSGKLLKGSIERWMAAHPGLRVEQIDIDYSQVDYTWGDGPVSSVAGFRQKGVAKVRLIAGSENRKFLESLVAACGIPGFVVEQAGSQQPG